jgi:hypothetical protein
MPSGPNRCKSLVSGVKGQAKNSHLAKNVVDARTANLDHLFIITVVDDEKTSVAKLRVEIVDC